MGIVKHYFLIFFLFFLCAGLGIAQELPQVHKINGEKFYLHVVEQGNTLYGISKLYQVDIEAINVHNPILKQEGLKVNQTLLIPVTADNKRALVDVVMQSGELLEHQVQPKETLYAISKKYSVSLEDLIKANPSIKDEGLKAGSIVNIPVGKADVDKPAHAAPAELDSLQAYIAKKGETLYSISKLHNTTVDQLYQLNPGLKEGLKEGMAIRIPSAPQTQQPVTTKPTITKEDPFEALVHNSFERKRDTTEPIQLCLLLPIDPVFPDSATALEDFSIPEGQRVALHFYRGFAFGIDSLASKAGVSIRVTLLASGQDTQSVGKLLRKGELDHFDLIVGPFYTQQFEMVADYLKARNVPVICPIPKPSKILFQRPNALKTTASESMQIDAIAEFLAHGYKDSNVVLVNSNKLPDQDLIEFFKSRYAAAMHVPDTFTDDAIREVKFWEVNREALTMRFPDSGSYVLVVPTKNKVFVTKFLSELFNLVYATKDKYEFRVIGLEDWEHYSSDLDVKQLHRLQITLPLTGYLDFTDYRVNDFYRKYEKHFGFEPDRITLTGFDVATMVISGYAQEGENWLTQSEKAVTKGLLSDFHFHRVDALSGMENQSVELYEFDSFKLKLFASWPLPKN